MTGQREGHKPGCFNPACAGERECFGGYPVGGYPAGDNKPLEDWNPPPQGPGAGMPRSQPTDLIQALTRAFLEADGYDPDTEMADPHPAGIAAHYRTLAQVAVRVFREAKDEGAEQ